MKRFKFKFDLLNLNNKDPPKMINVCGSGHCNAQYGAIVNTMGIFREVKEGKGVKNKKEEDDIRKQLSLATKITNIGGVSPKLEAVAGQMSLQK